MSTRQSNTPFGRRRALAALGGTVTGGGLLATGTALAGVAAPPGIAASRPRGSIPVLRAAAASDEGGQLPVQRIEAALQAPGDVSGSGVLSVSLERTDLTHVTRNGVPWLPSFDVNGDANFQALGEGRAIVNGDVALLSQEVNPFIAALLENGLVFQALHQHFTDLSPQIWHVHYRGVGEPVRLAQALFRAVKQTTATPFPQQKASSPSTPLPVKQMEDILGGKGSVGAHGTVSFGIPRSDRIVLGGVPIAGDAGIGLTIAFQPLDGGRAVAAPDFSMLASEVDPVMQVMLARGWEIGCLYNQETDEQPQLYFSHQSKIGAPLDLALEIRQGADKTKLAFKS